MLFIKTTPARARRKLPPGKLHDLRSACLNNGRLAAIAAAHGLQRYLRHASQVRSANVYIVLLVASNSLGCIAKHAWQCCMA